MIFIKKTQKKLLKLIIIFLIQVITIVSLNAEDKKDEVKKINNGENYIIPAWMWLDYQLLEIERNNTEKLKNFFKSCYDESIQYIDSFKKTIKSYQIGFTITLSFAIINFCLFIGILTGLITYFMLKSNNFL